MKSRAFLLMAMLFSAASGLYGQQQPLEIKEADVDVRLDFVESPKIGADNVSPMPSSGLSAQKWLEVSVLYVMPSRIDPKTKQMDWIDDMSVIVRILLPAEYRGEKVTAMLSGKAVLMSVPCDGKKHRISMFVPHVILARYAANDFKLNKTSSKELPAAVLFQTKQQQPLGGGFCIAKGSSRAATLNAFKEADAKLNILKLEDSILPRELTPWAHLDFDAFDMPKLTSGSK
jgi:hypothetical protein